MKKFFLPGLILLIGLIMAWVLNRPQPFTVEGELIVLGDSITDGTLNYGRKSFGYRKALQDELGIHTYRFKGQFESGHGHQYQRAHSGVIGETNLQIRARLDANLKLYSRTPLKRHPVLLIHAGTNDLAGDHMETEAELKPAVDVLKDIIQTVHRFDKNIDIYVALLIPSTVEPKNTNVALYNRQVARMLAALKFPNVYSVDMNSAFTKDAFGLCSGNWMANCMFDHLHPNHRGYELMGRQWAACIKNPAAVNCNGEH